MTRRNLFGCALIALAIGVGGADSAHALLGSFTANDGYFPQYNTILGEVSHYNAGANGINAGGGAAMQIVADSGLWKGTGAIGGVFTNPAFLAGSLASGFVGSLFGANFKGMTSNAFILVFIVVESAAWIATCMVAWNTEDETPQQNPEQKALRTLRMATIFRLLIGSVIMAPILALGPASVLAFLKGGGFLSLLGIFSGVFFLLAFAGPAACVAIKWLRPARVTSQSIGK